MMYKTKVTNLLTEDEKSIPYEYKDCEVKDGKYGQYKEVKIVDNAGNVIEKTKKFIPLGGAVYVEEQIIDIDTLEVTLKLYFTNGESEKNIVYFPRTDLVDGKILALATYGVQVTKQSSQVLIKCLMNQETNAPQSLTYKELGFGTYKDKKIFKGSKALGMKAEYTGKLRVSPIGSYEEYIKMITEEVIGQIPLEFILAVSISGMLVDFLKDQLSLENIVVHLVGQSSTGKTTSALLAVASGSAPDFMGDNFVFSFQDTQNSLMKMIPSSYCTLIDEGSLIGRKDMTQAMYSLSSGVEKRRLTKNLDIQDVSRFRTALILSSEKSILSQCNENSGLLVRNIEIDNVVYTQSAKSADRIKNTIRNNYGFLVPKVAEWLLDKGENAVADMVIKETDYLIQQAKDNDEYNNLTERSAKQSALILVSVDILGEVLGLCFNKPEIIEFMHEHSLVKDNEIVSMGKRAMEYLLQVITKDYTQFLREGYESEVKDCKGRLKKVQDRLLKTGEISKMQLLITREEFVRVLQKGHFSEEKIILKEWKELGYLQAQRDRCVSDVKIQKDIISKGYIINLPTKESKKEENKVTPKQTKNQCEEDLSFLDREEVIDFEDE